MSFLARSLASDLQGKWDDVNTSRFTHSILPNVSLRPWFEDQREDRKFVSTVSRITSGHYAARSHYGTVDYLICHCKRLETQRRHLT
jgi:hypothetical protein